MSPIGDKPKREEDDKEELNRVVNALNISRLDRCEGKAVVDDCRCNKDRGNNKREHSNEHADSVLPTLWDIFRYQLHTTKLVNISLHHKVLLSISCSQVIIYTKFGTIEELSGGLEAKLFIEFGTILVGRNKNCAVVTTAI